MRVPGQPYEAGASTGLQRKPGDVRDVHDTADARRLIVERLQPEIDGGRFPIKRTVGESVSVTVDLFADGHDLIAGVLKYRHVPAGPPPSRVALRREAPAPQQSQWAAPQDPLSAGSGSAKEAADPALWTEVPLTDFGNDRWGASFAVTEPGEYEYTVEGWIDRFGTWSAGLIAKADAGQDVTSELLEGAPLAEHDRRGSTTYDRILRVIVDPLRARFGAWYEMFPRSCTQDPTRSGTFRDAEARLPDIAAMGFDVVYLPPVHPIGRTHRKGPNNSLNSRPGDPGSPWAIGSDEGGHTAIEPGLGTLDDFDRFVDTASHLGLDIALDIAFQTSPDHPWVREHPEWFKRRPDGSIKYAENPPKKYQDIYPFDFESDDRQALWRALRDVFLFWIAHGVTIFRVDNPHTKSFRFWEWCIADIKRAHPDAIFLAEAFTRPKVMRYLAKAGFTQSYTYFTWRNTAGELREYLTELTQTEVAEYLRPNFFANTPDILHAFLQHGGRAAFEVRFVLAATLGASYGIYSGFELAEGQAIPGTEEYADSEKYQFRKWDWERPGNIAELVCRVNEIRHAHRALQFDSTLRFHATDNPEIIAYSKRAPGSGETILVVVNLDPLHMQHGHVELPGLGPDETYTVRDLLDEVAYEWRGAWNYVRFDPDIRQGHILWLPTHRI